MTPPLLHYATVVKWQTQQIQNLYNCRFKSDRWYHISLGCIDEA
jgi:hypothetical protein